LFPKVLVPIVKRMQLRSGYSWTYVHPYDLSDDIPVQFPGEPRGLKSLLLRARRHSSLRRYLSLVDSGESSLGEFATTLLDAELPKITVRTFSA
jgi:hypothetical protein